MDCTEIRFDQYSVTDGACAAGPANARPVSFRRPGPDRAVRPGEGAFGYRGPRRPHALRAYLAHDFAQAEGWAELRDLLRAKGYALAGGKDDLVLQTVEGERLCEAAEIGQPCAMLMKRFGAPFPDHRSPRPASPHSGPPVLPL
ncbi:hypothetical protein [Celeribacter indicus]|uniref:Uncharacterized protein n=1 Tax=Celeribacter indicus TaxID=1208324 RepID=A0A0B5DU53_9RHOB|nr:hypothetical protein [Celeribacter indicus]AJE44755.1 hypothetical protein P73_0040 [Celeribacter indicus]SDX50276.1 hypothetical protein SAMN05443573_13424 [Celeribacter indicus]